MSNEAANAENGAEAERPTVASAEEGGGDGSPAAVAPAVAATEGKAISCLLCVRLT